MIVLHARLGALAAICLLLAAGSVRAEPATLDVPEDSAVLHRQVEEASDRIRAEPESARHYLARGEARFRLREFDVAIEDFTTAIRLDAKTDNAYFGRGMALARNGDIAGGIADLSVYIERNPNSSLAYTKRGVRHIWLGDLDSAERDLTRAIELNPANAEAHDDFGVICAQRGEYTRAIHHFRSAVQHEPNYQKAWHNLAMAYYLTNDEGKALAAVDRCLAHGENRNSLMLKAVILESIGRVREAKVTREKAEFLPEGGWSEHMPVR